MDRLITANKLKKIYNNKIIAVNNVDLHINKGFFYAIMGHSGSGKTTMLNLLGLLDNASSGEIIIEEKAITSLSAEQKAEIRMTKFGFVFQSYFLNPKLKAYENIMLPMYINNKYKFKDMKPKAFQILKSLNLDNRSNHFPKELSGGEQQRVAIARALANDPECIFADEPTGNLDVDNEKTVLGILKDLCKMGKTAVVASHNDIILDYADKVFNMSNGTLEVLK